MERGKEADGKIDRERWRERERERDRERKGDCTTPKICINL